MTDEMMNLRTLLEKSSDTDLLREMIGAQTAYQYRGGPPRK